MEVQVADDVAVATAGPLTLALSGSFDPNVALQRRLGRLLPELSSLIEAPRRERSFRMSGSYALQMRHLIKQWSKLRTEPDGDLLLRQAHDIQRFAAKFAPDHRGVAHDIAAGLIASSRAFQKAAPSLIDAPVLFDAFASVAALTQVEGAVDPDAGSLLRFGYGSPWYIEASVVLSGGASLTGLLFGLSKAFGIDLEVRLHRTELRLQLERAQAELRRLRENEGAAKGLTEWADRSDGPPETPAELEHRRWLQARVAKIDFFPWTLKRAILSDEDDQ